MCRIPSSLFRRPRHSRPRRRDLLGILAEQEKAIVYNELVTNAVALQTVADQTNALHELRRRGIDVTAEDLSYFSPYPTSKVKRFGEYPARINAESALPNRNLPARAPAIEMPAP